MTNYTITTVTAQKVLTTIQRSTQEHFKDLFSEWFPKLHQYAKSIGASISGSPFARYHQFDAEGVVLELGVPILMDLSVNGEFSQSEIPATKVLVIEHIGPYDNLNKAWSALANALKGQNLEYNGPCWESYITDPDTEPDPNKWVTKLYQPIK